MEKDPYACITSAIWQRAHNCRSNLVYFSPNDPSLVESPLGVIKSVLAGLEKSQNIEILERPASDPIFRGTGYEHSFYAIRILSELPTLETLSKSAANIVGSNSHIHSNNTLTVAYNPQMGVTIDGIFRLTKPHAGSENEKVLEFLLEYPNKEHTKHAIEGALHHKLTKNLYDIIRGLGFENELMKLFFPKISQDIIQFNNPVAKQDMMRLGIHFIPISSKSSKSVKKKRGLEDIEHIARVNPSASEEMASVCG
ncbi:MAG: hypothetical protein SFX19_06220 [Alphaproteobacteria bacterium]|nr:hypothetical protein [Alphaproteobacteria bacterium]